MHLEDLTTDQQNYLNRNTVNQIYCKLTIEADDGDVVLNDDIMSVSDIRLKKRIDLDEKMEQFTGSEIKIKLINEDNKYDREEIGSDFDIFSTQLLEDVDNTDTYVVIAFMESAPLGLSSINDLVGKIITMGDGKVSWTATITSITEQGTGDDKKHRLNITPINYNSGSTYDYNIVTGSYLEINQLVGRIATMEYLLGSISDTIIAHKGLIANVPDIGGEGAAELVIQDAFTKLLQTALYANYAETKAYDRENDPPSTGTLTLDWDNPKYRCPIAEWEIEILTDESTYYTYQVTYPNGQTTKNGRTDQTWVSDENDYYYFSALVLTGADWSSYGSFDVGDKITIQTYYKQSTAAEPHYADVLNDIVSDAVGTDLANTMELVTMQPRLANNPLAIFKKQISCLQAAASMCQHLNVTMYPGSDGKIHYFLIQPELGDDPKSLSYTEDAFNVRLTHRDRVRGVKVLYDYDWDEKEFTKEYLYPEDWRGEYRTLRLGNFTTESQAKFQAQYYLALWEKGLRIVDFNEKFNYGIAFSLNDIFEISSIIPKLQDNLIMLYEMTKSKKSDKVDVKALDMNFIWGDYGYCDISKCDDGKICW